MRPTPFSIDVSPDGDRTIVTPHGELDLATVDELAHTLEGVVDGGARTIVLDLRDLSFLDSTGLRLLVEQTRREDASVQLVGGAAPVSRLFELTGLRDVLPFVSLPHDPLRSDDPDGANGDRPEELGLPTST
jgi:anti-anti-sigma factor